MMFKKNTVLSILIILLSAAVVQAQEFQDKADKIANQIVNTKFRKARKSFSPEVKSKMSTAKLILTWKMIQAQVGEFKSLGKSEYSQKDGGELYIYKTEFEDALLQLKLGMNEQGKVSGFVFLPLDYEMPSYATNMTYGKERLKVKTDTFEMPGELIIPDGCDQCPVVILVHGSGASNMDEFIKPNKVFYDLAMGLASKGVASFRYDKRSYVYKDLYAPNKTKHQYDLYDETIDDTYSAIDLVKQFSYLDTNKIYVVGHSLGAYSAPIMASERDDLAGIVMMAGPARPLQSLIVSQYEFLFSKDGKLSLPEKTLINKQKKIERQLNEGSFDTLAPSGKLMANWPGEWWKYVSVYNPSKYLSELDSNSRVLIMQGGQDYQVEQINYEMYKSAFSDSSNFSFKLYPELNHLFMESKKEDGAAGYMTPNNIPIDVIEDMAKWLKK